MSISLSKYSTCRHTKTDGLRCQAPALSTSVFCYHHRKLRRPLARRPRPLTSQPLPQLTDRKSVDHALYLVLNGLSTGKLDNRTAGQMIHVIQLVNSRL
jgi:hypothetical protein